LLPGAALFDEVVARAREVGQVRRQGRRQHDVPPREHLEGVRRQRAARGEHGDGDDAPDLLPQKAAAAHLDDDLCAG